MRNLIFKLTLLLVLLFFSSSVNAEKLRLSTLNWEPYIGEKLKEQGFVAEVVKKAYASEGYEVELTYLPWARVVAMAKNGEFDGYLPEYYAESLKKDFLVSDPYPGGPLVFFKRKGQNITFNSLNDLKPYTIGVVRGYVNTVEFDNASFLKKDPVRDDITNIKKLTAGRIDLMVADKFVGYHLIETQYPKAKGKLDVVEPVLEKKELYLCISKKTANSAKKLSAFNNGLKKLTSSGDLDKILKKHGF
jgi:polar amino acid transport system substrate-binding protein